MARLSASQVQDKWNRRLKGAIEDMRTGVEGVTESPTKKAAAKKDKMRARVVEAIDSGKWADGLNRVTVDEWRKKMVDLGLTRVSAGVDASSDKVEAFFNELLPYIESGQGAVEKMPDVTLEDSINRMTTFVRHMAKFRRSR